MMVINRSSALKILARSMADANARLASGESLYATAIFLYIVLSHSSFADRPDDAVVDAMICSDMARNARINTCQSNVT
jgi:hypothetical protein